MTAASHAVPARVAAHERELISVARAIVGQGSFAAIEETLASSVPVTTLGPSAMAILEDTLAKGVVKMLARLGGAQPRLRPATRASAKPMRAFDVRPVPVLAFGPYSFALLRWLTAVPVGDVSAPAFDGSPRTIGDHVLAYLTLRLVANGRLERAIAARSSLHRSPLAWLGHARVLARWAQPGGPAPTAAPSFEQLLAHDDGKIVVECLAGDLAQRWTTASRRSGDPDVLDAPDALRIALAEQRTLEAFLGTIERLERWDLAAFLVEAGARLLPSGTPASEVAARALQPVHAVGTLRDRSDARRRSGAVFHALARIGAKREKLSLVRFFEDGYDDAQSLLASWEALGREGFARAEDVVRALAALDAPAPSVDAAKEEK